MESFTINDIDVKSYAPEGVDILIRAAPRPLILPKTKHKVFIPGRNYSWDFGGEAIRDFPISVDLYILGDSYAAALSCARNIEAALEGESVLVFDEEETKEYTVKVYDSVILTREGTMGINLVINFECSGVEDLGS